MFVIILFMLWIISMIALWVLKLHFFKFLIGSVGSFCFAMYFGTGDIQQYLEYGVTAVIGIIGQSTGLCIVMAKYSMITIYHGVEAISFFVDYECSGFVEMLVYAVETKESEVIELLSQVTGFEAYRTPKRDLVRMEMTQKRNTISIHTQEAGVVTDLSSIDAFVPIEGTYKSVHNLVYIQDRDLTIKVTYPYLQQGIIVSLVGILMFIGFFVVYQL